VLARLGSQIHFQEAIDGRPFLGTSFAVQTLSQLDAVQRVEDLEESHRTLDFVGLKGPDQMPACRGGKDCCLLFRLLNPILSKDSETGVPGSLQAVERLSLTHSQKLDL